MILIEVKQSIYLNHLQLIYKKHKHRIYSLLWIKQSFIKINHKIYESLCIMSHC